MEWQQFEYFQTVARMQHMTRAAEALSISQSALSRSIARFEEEIGVPLFERQGRSIRLNQYGYMFLTRVDNMMREFDAGKQEIQELLEPDRGKVSLGFLHTLSTNHIPDLIALFRTRYPNIHFQLRQSPSHTLLEQLVLGELDLCLVAPMEIHPPIQWTKLWSEELYVIVPKDHTFADRESIALAELAEEPFVLLKKGFSLRIDTERWFQQAGITPRIMFEGEEADTVAELVAAGLGVSILPDLKGTDQSNITQVRLSWPKCQREIGLAYVKGRYLSPAAAKFKQFILDHFNERTKQTTK